MTDKTQRTYPYKAWVLMPSFTPAEVELVGESDSYLIACDYTSDGKHYDRNQLFATKADVINEGWARIEKQAANLAKSIETLVKKRAALRKAEQP